MRLILWLIGGMMLVPVMAMANDPFVEGKALFEQGDYAAALLKLQQACREEPGNLDASFYLGRAAFESGDYETAVMAYEQILIMVPKAPRVRLELARAYLQLGSYELARQHLLLVQKTNPPEAVWQTIQELLGAIDAAGQRNFFNGFVTVGYLYDDNVGVFPKSDTFFINGLPYRLSQKQESDHGLQTTLVLNHLYRINPAYAWKTGLFTYNNLYDTANDYNLNSFGLTTGLLRKSGREQWELQGVATQVNLDNDRYFGMVGANGNYSRRLGRFMYVNFGAILLDKTYYQDGDRDATTWGVSLNPVIHYGDNRISFSLAREDEDAVKDRFSYERVSAAVRYDRRLPYDFAAYGSFHYQNTDYEDPLPLFDEERSDTQTTLEAGVSKTFWRSTDRRQSLALQLSHTYIKAESNIALYEYDKNVTLTALTFAF